MTDDDRQKLLEKIKKLLALGQSPFDEEARTSLHKAFKLMKEHGIELSEVAGSGEPSDDDVVTQAAELVVDYMRANGSKGGLKGGPARARKLSAKRRSEIARKAGLASGAARRRSR